MAAPVDVRVHRYRSGDVMDVALSISTGGTTTRLDLTTADAAVVVAALEAAFD